MPEEQITLPALPVAALVRKRYQIRHVLASGSSGAIYLVKDQQAKNIRHQFFALKEIAGLDQQARYRLTVGSVALRQLRHPALPVIHAIFNDDKRGCVYIVMDYVEGLSLDTLRQQRPAKRLNWSELRGFCEQIAGALTYLHLQENPLFHGDLKPASIVRSNTGRIFLLGLDYTQPVLPEPGKHSASHSNNRAPEQFSGETSELSDVYGLGAVLYDLLTGQPPVDAVTRMARVNKRRSDPLVLASKVAPGVPRPLAEALQRALALNPAERFRSIKEFWQALSLLPVLEQEAAPLVSRQKVPNAGMAIPVDAIPTRISHTPPAAEIARATRSRRSLLPIVAILCALLLMLAGLGTFVWAHNHAGTPGRPASTVSSGQQGSPATGNQTPAPDTSRFVKITGIYQGTFNFLNQLPIDLSVTITDQKQGQFTGTFASPLQSGSVSGQIDNAKRISVVMQFNDASNNAYLYLWGGFNGIYDSQINTQDNMAGSFYRCKHVKGSICVEDNTPGSGGAWSLSFVSSV